MPQEITDQLINSGSYRNPKKRKNTGTDVTNAIDWDSTATRIFDVYVNSDTDSQQNLNLLDTFSDGIKDRSDNNSAITDTKIATEKDLNDSMLNLSNTTTNLNEDENENGNGNRLNQLGSMDLTKGRKTNMFGDIKKRKLNMGQNPSSVLNLANNSANLISAMSPKSKPTSPISQLPKGNSASFYLKDGNDIWTKNIEEVFIRALRLVLKNGTSKIKLRDKNYGRNELISLYIKYFTGEFRTKKQISSHIQVWKKAILNKVSKRIQLTDMDQELLTLIEEGARQTEESTKAFHEIFETILNHPKSYKESVNYVPVMMQTIISENDTMSTLENSVKNKYENTINSGYPSNESSSSNYPSLITPKSAQTSTSNNANTFSNIDPAHFPINKSLPVTPLDYAKSIYENLKGFKCVPVKLEDETYSSFLTDLHSSGTVVHENSDRTTPLIGTLVKNENNENNVKNIENDTSSGNALDTAKRVQLEQRKLIEELNHKSKSNNFLNSSSIVDRSVNNNSFYEKQLFTLDDIASRQREWPILQESASSLYASQQVQSQGAPSTISVKQKNASHYLPSQSQSQAQMQPQGKTHSLYQGQYVVLPQQQQTQQSTFIPYPQHTDQQSTFIPYQQHTDQQQISSSQPNQQSPMYYYQRHAYIPPSNNYPNSQYRPKQTISNDYLQPYPNNNQDDE